MSVRAAGGIIVRGGRVLLVHRPKYDDWTLPKGKLDDGESWEEAAVRELREETSLECEIGEEAGRTYYVDHEGREKEVRYFWITATGEPAPQNEIDELRWVPLDEAAHVLSYERDVELLSRLA